MKKIIVAMIIIVASLVAMSAYAEDLFYDCEDIIYTTPVMVNDDGTYSGSVLIGDHWAITAITDDIESSVGTIRITCDGAIAAERIVDMDSDEDWDWYFNVLLFIEYHLEGCEFIQLGA